MFKKFKILHKSIAIILCLAIAIGIMPVMPAFAYTSAPKRNWSYYYDNSSTYPISNLMNKIGSDMDNFLNLADSRGVYTLYLWGPNWSYTNLTYNRMTSPVMATEWYDSFYGPFLYYLQSLPSDQRLSTSIAFSKARFPSSDRVYIGWNVNDLADAKAVATLPPMRSSGSYALLVTDSYSDPLLQAELKRLNAKHIVLLGGAGLYDSMAAIGDCYNVIRVGGKNREETLWLAKNMSSNFFAQTKPPYNKGTYTFIDNVGLPNAKTIEGYLAQGNFAEAARQVIKTQHGSQGNVVNGTPAVIIGVNDSFLFSYYSIPYYGCIVCQYFGPEYPEFPNSPPVAQFSVSPNPLPISKNLVVNDSSYDPDGDPIVECAWVVEKDGTTVHQGSSLPANYSSYGAGNYKITLRVRDNPDTGTSLWSEPYSQTFEVIPDNRKPIADFIISPTTIPLDAGDTITITDKSSDPDSDPIVTWEWQVKKADGDWVSVDTPPIDLEYYGIGTHFIRLRVKDQPRLPQLDPLWSDWVEKFFTVIPGNQKPIARFTITPNPVSADEPITYNDTSYDPEGKAITERLWTIKCVETGQVYQYSNQIPPTIFEETGWGINGDGIGTYEITLKVKDSSPNGISPSRWSDPVTQKLAVEDLFRINSLVMTAIINPPLGTQTPVVYPVTTPIKVKAGYRMTFSVNTNGGNRLDIKFYANGQPLTVHTDSGDTNTITMATVRKNASTTFSFWTDEDLPAGTVMDMKIILTKIKGDGTEKSIVNNELGEHFAVIVGSAKEDSSINLTR